MTSTPAARNRGAEHRRLLRRQRRPGDFDPNLPCPLEAQGTVTVG